MTTVKLQLISKCAPPLYASVAVPESFRQNERFHMKCFASLHSHFQLKAASFVDAKGRSQAIRQPLNLIEPLEIIIQLQMIL